MFEHLPPFSAILAFDAAVRGGSFANGAQLLNVTQPAISRRIALLEQQLGVQLFDRRTKPNQLTKHGQQFHAAVRAGLAGLESAVSELRAAARERTITISAGSGFASYWLLPRLGPLKLAFPDLDLRILSGDGAWSWSEVDLRIEFGEPPWPNAEASLIQSEEVYAVGHPSLLDGAAGDLSLDAIDRMMLLDLRDPAERWHSWDTWFKALDHNPSSPVKTIQFDSYSLLISAALAGQGVALGWSGLLDAFLESGALVTLSDRAVASQRGYHVLHPPSLGSQADARKVANWLKAGGQ